MASVQRRAKAQRTLDPLDELEIRLYVGPGRSVSDSVPAAWREHGAELIAREGRERFRYVLDAFGEPVPRPFRDAWDA